MRIKGARRYPTPFPLSPSGGWPRISVVVPSYNQGKFLGDTLDSILSQNYPNLECIVVDGGSTDNSIEIIQSVADQLAWWCSEKDDGHAHALNKGFAKATGEVLCWLNSDDMFAPWCLWIIGDIFDKFQQVEWVTGDYGIWDTFGRLVRTYPGGASAVGYLRQMDLNIQQESTFWRRSLWVRSGGHIELSYSLMIDAELWLRFFRHSTLYSLKTVVSGYRWHGQNRALIHNDLAQAERWLAIKTHVAPTSWKTQLVTRLGQNQYNRGIGLWNVIRFIFFKRVRKALLKSPVVPGIYWDTINHDWVIQPDR